ncbi:MAG: class I SAM-dependent methyltransferase, partial [Terriglobales bacterium]
MPAWRDIWAARRLDGGAGSTLARLLAADGFDTGFGTMPEAAWRDYVMRCAARLDLRPGDSLFEVGCGAGALLYPLAEHGCRVGGIDYSAALIAAARAALPDGDWRCAEAGAPLPAADFVVASGVFLYFPSL